jgi:hypothetical protein
VARALEWARRHGLAVHWGSFLSGDIALLPERAARLHGTELWQAVESRGADALAQAGVSIAQVNLLADADRDLATRRMGVEALRRLALMCETQAPQASVGVHVADAFRGTRLQQARAAVIDLRMAFVPVKSLCLDSRFEGLLTHDALARRLRELEKLEAEVLLTRLTVDGETPAGAALNLETALRTALATPHVRGVFLPGYAIQHHANPGQSLFDDQGAPTEVAQRLDQLVTGQWGVERRAKADSLGNARLRVMAGRLEVRVELADGGRASQTLVIAPGVDERVLVIQPIATAGPADPAP